MLTTAAASKTFTSTSGHSTVVEASSNWTNSDFCPERILPAQEREGGLPWFSCLKNSLKDYPLLPGTRYRASQTDYSRSLVLKFDFLSCYLLGFLSF